MTVWWRLWDLKADKLGNLKQAIKEAFPAVTIIGDFYRWMRRTIRRLFLFFVPRARVFSWYFATNKWGDSQSFSGAGSNMESTKTLRRHLPDFFASLGIKSVVDAPCGDFNWMKELDLGGIEYTGMDIVEEIVALNVKKYSTSEGGGRKFVRGDLCKDPLPQADLIFCRDALVHLSGNDVFAAIGMFKQSGATWLMTTAYPEVKENRAISTGMWRPLNLCLAPFNFPAPRRIFDEKTEGNEGRHGPKCMFLWRVADLP